jgi:hypothetical protein
MKEWFCWFVVVNVPQVVGFSGTCAGEEHFIFKVDCDGIMLEYCRASVVAKLSY